MNRRQITIAWISLTILLPTVYFIVSRGSQIEHRAGTNRAIRENATQPATYIIEESTTGKMWEIKSEHFPSSEAEIEKLIANGRLLSESEAAAWREKDAIQKQRRSFWELSCAGIFCFVSLAGLFLYRSSKQST